MTIIIIIIILYIITMIFNGLTALIIGYVLIDNFGDY